MQELSSLDLHSDCIVAGRAQSPGMVFGDIRNQLIDEGAGFAFFGKSGSGPAGEEGLGLRMSHEWLLEESFDVPNRREYRDKCTGWPYSYL